MSDGLVVGEDGVALLLGGLGLPEYRAYHDAEWGLPVADDRRLFEKLCLEGFQSGLSWLTILRKREAFRRAFAGFDFDARRAIRRADVERLLATPAIVRHRGKIEATINNARARRRAGRGGRLARGLRVALRAVAAAAAAATATPSRDGDDAESRALAKDLKRRGWRFVGPTTVYAFMQAMGLVNDHLDGCAVREQAERARESASARR